jgi:LytR cell envelope-related transcriptional attenuator
VDAPLSPHELVRPWRRATIVASLVAAVELVLLLGAAALLVAKPLSHAIQRHAEAVAYAPAKKAAVFVPPPKPKPVGKAKIARSRMSILVLNGNGVNGAAAAEAAKLHGLGYKIAATADARRHDYATSVVMYRPGFQAEGMRLARDMHVKIVGPLDGVTKSALHGSQLAVVLGAG